MERFLTPGLIHGTTHGMDARWSTSVWTHTVLECSATYCTGKGKAFLLACCGVASAIWKEKRQEGSIKGLAGSPFFTLPCIQPEWPCLWGWSFYSRKWEPVGFPSCRTNSSCLPETYAVGCMSFNLYYSSVELLTPVCQVYNLVHLPDAYEQKGTGNHVHLRKRGPREQDSLFICCASLDSPGYQRKHQKR